MVHGFNTLTTLTLYVLKLLEQLLIIYWLVSIDLGFFQEKSLGVLVVNTLSNHDITFFMSAKDSTNTGIWEEI